MSLSPERYSNKQKIRLVFYCLWLTLSAIQALGTNLIPDEAYYWEYSRQPAWGYFDHPPVIAIMIKWGYALVKNELGVRLLSILAIAGTIYLTERITKPEKLLYYYLAVASVAVFHIAGILAVPDVPLMFFTAMFFLLYRKYLVSHSYYVVVLLSLNIALLLLSKYHGILILFFTLLSNLTVLRRRSFWVVVLLSAAFFLPHVAWQWQHDFPSIKYHLQGRNTGGYQFNFTTDYLAAIPLVFAPCTGIVLLYYTLRYPAATRFERTLKYNTWGIVLFFLLMSFRGRIEANWLFIAIIPAVSLGYRSVSLKNRGYRFIRISFIVSIAVIVTARVLLIDGVWKKDSDFSGWKQWVATVQQQAEGKPVAFINSYQKAAEYAFYSGQPSFSLSNVMGRKDQYGIWNYEDKLQGKDIMLVSNFYVDSLRSFATNKGDLQYSMISNFRSASNIIIHTVQDKIKVTDEDSITVDFSFEIREGSTVDAEDNPDYPMLLNYEFFNKDGFVSHTVSDVRISNELLRSNKLSHISIPSPQKRGNYTLLLSISAGWMPPSNTGGKVLIDRR